MRLVLWGLQVPGESEALLEREVRWDQTDFRDLKVAPEPLDQTDQRAQQEPKGASERTGLRGSWECPERGVSQDRQDPREMLEVWETRDLKAKQELMGHEDWLVPWGLLDQVDLTERRERWDLQDQRADEEPEESLVPLETPVPLALLDSQDLLDLMASLE